MQFPNLASLPAELLLDITKGLPQHDLTALCRTSLFHGILTPCLYRKVFYKGLPQSGRCLQFHSHHSGDDVLFNPANEATTIYKLGAFLQTMIARQHLRSLIKIIYINVDARGQPEFYKDAEHLLRLLGRSPDVIHLSAHNFVTNIPLKIRTLTSLHLTQDSWSSNDPIAELDHLYSVFSVDSLRRLSVERCSPLLRGEDTSVKMRNFSNVAHLSYTEYGFQSDDLVHVIGWPAKLQSLWYEWKGGARSLVTAYRTIATALQIQKACVEELYISMSCPWHIWPQQVMLTSLNEFSSLKRPGIPRAILMSMQPRPENRGMPNSGDLPSHLEELQIECEDDFAWLGRHPIGVAGSEGYIAGIPSDEAYHLLDMLASIVENTPYEFSRLRRIALWLRYDQPDSRLQEDWPPEAIKIDVLQKQFADRGVELMCLQEPWPPLFV